MGTDKGTYLGSSRTVSWRTLSASPRDYRVINRKLHLSFILLCIFHELTKEQQVFLKPTKLSVHCLQNTSKNVQEFFDEWTRNWAGTSPSVEGLFVPPPKSYLTMWWGTWIARIALIILKHRYWKEHVCWHVSGRNRSRKRSSRVDWPGGGVLHRSRILLVLHENFAKLLTSMSYL